LLTASLSAGERSAQLGALVDEFWQYRLHTEPEFASVIGDKRYNDRLSEFSEKAVYQDLAGERVHVPLTAGISRAELPSRRQRGPTGPWLTRAKTSTLLPSDQVPRRPGQSQPCAVRCFRRLAFCSEWRNSRPHTVQAYT